jgi:hypothetical protein
MDTNQKIAIEMLEEIDRARSGQRQLEELEERLWRLLDGTDEGFPPVLAGKVEDLVLDLKRLRQRNLSFGPSHTVDEDRGSEDIYNDIIGAISRYLA